MVELQPLDETGYEKELLREYGAASGGRIIAEAPVAGDGPDQPWPAGSSSRWLDGLRIPSEFTNRDIGVFRYRSGYRPQLIEDVTAAEVEVIEVKKSLNRPVVGQGLVGADMFRMEYHVAKVTPVIVVGTTDPAIEIVCEKRGIEVWKSGRGGP